MDVSLEKGLFFLVPFFSRKMIDIKLYRKCILDVAKRMNDERNMGSIVSAMGKVQ